jgi:hypothetical protein
VALEAYQSTDEIPWRTTMAHDENTALRFALENEHKVTFLPTGKRLGDLERGEVLGG